MKQKYYTKAGYHPDDAINKVKVFINELQVVQEKYYTKLLKDLDQNDSGLDDWLFDYIYNEDPCTDLMFTEYLEDRGKSYEELAKKN